MSVAWWVGMAFVFYCLPGVYFYAVLLDTPITGVPEEVMRPPYPLWFKVAGYAIALPVSLLLWPVMLWIEYRHGP